MNNPDPAAVQAAKGALSDYLSQSGPESSLPFFKNQELKNQAEIGLRVRRGEDPKQVVSEMLARQKNQTAVSPRVKRVLEALNAPANMDSNRSDSLYWAKPVSFSARNGEVPSQGDTSVKGADLELAANAPLAKNPTPLTKTQRAGNQAQIEKDKAEAEQILRAIPDNTIPQEGGRGAIIFHDTGIAPPEWIERGLDSGDLRELLPKDAGPKMQFYGLTEQGYKNKRVNKRQ